MKTQPTLPIFYAGFDPGSGVATLYVSPEDTLEEIWSTSLSSIVGDGDLVALAGDRGAAMQAAPASVLREGEIAIHYQGLDYYVGKLADKEGINATDALGAADRYWSLHSLVLLLALIGRLIPERRCEVRLVTALPVTLYRKKEDRTLVSTALQGHHTFCFQGQQREVHVKVGRVVMEGLGALVAHSEGVGEEAVIDIGKRTVDLIVAEDLTPIRKWCDGEPIGVGQVADGVVQALKNDYGRVLTEMEVDALLYAYAHGLPFPSITTDEDDVAVERLSSLIEAEISRVGRAIQLFISRTWNEEGARLASRFRRVYLVGGGAYYFQAIIRQFIKKVRVPERPEDANAAGYLDLAIGLEDHTPTIWEESDYDDEETRLEVLGNLPSR